MSEPAIAIDNLSGHHREIAELIGLDNYIKLSRRFGGDSPYILKYEELLKPARDAMIQEDFDGFNTRELARKYGLSVRSIYYKIPKSLRIKTKARPLADQLSMY